MIIEKNFFTLYIGNASDSLFPQEYLNLDANQPLLKHPSFAHLQQLLQLRELVFLHQLHVDYGQLVTAQTLRSIKSFKTEGDFLITNLPSVGLGVMTADCLPLMLFDSRNHVVAVVHAGWKGSVQLIAKKVVHAIEQSYGSKKENIEAIFGPCAQVCCYEVAHDFIQELARFPFGQEALVRKDGKLFFDLPLFNQLQLESVGIARAAIDRSLCTCTIHDESYFSYRRQQKNAGRQMFVVALR